MRTVPENSGPPGTLPRTIALLTLILVGFTPFARGDLSGGHDVVLVSVKHVVDATGSRSVGYFTRDEQIHEAFRQANQVLQRSDAGWRLEVDEIVDVEGISRYFDLSTGEDVRALEREARQSPDAYGWRSDAINFYVVNTLHAGGMCSFPVGDDIIVINNAHGILNDGVGWLHEVGHYLSLLHTFQCDAPYCDPYDCTGAGAYHDAPRGFVDCPENCPDGVNVMSYYSIARGAARFSACQLREMEYELYDPRGKRSQVVTRPTPLFRRGDTTADGSLGLTDAVFLLNYLFLGGTQPSCLKSADADDDGALGVSDAIRVLNHLYSGGPAPAAPYPFCGSDLTADGLTCDAFEPCR